MSVRPIMFAWCLLLGATVLMAAGAWWLLGREADRVEALAAGTLANRTAAVADNIDLLMEEMRGGVMDGLLAVRDLPQPRIALAEMVEASPYARVGYYFRGSDGVTVWLGERGELPAPGAIQAKADSAGAVYPWTLPEFESDQMAGNAPSPSTVKELAKSKAPSDAYAYRQQTLPPPPASAPAVEEVESGLEDAFQEQALSQNVALKQQREAVRKVNVDNRLDVRGYYSPPIDKFSAAQKAEGEEVSVLDTDEATSRQTEFANEGEQRPNAEAKRPIRKGWAVSRLNGRQQWMAWAGLPNGTDYIGVWLNREAVLAELSKAINLSQNDGLRFRLVDAEGRVVAGDYGPRYTSSAVSPEMALAVGSALPDWRIETLRANGANTFGSSFRFVGGLFIGGLSLAILIGSAVLIWQSRRDARDAQLKTTFVANVSHELKTPLTSIRLFADMLHDGRVKEESKQREYLQRMLNETQRLTRLVNNVLDFSRLERGQRRAKSDSLDLCATVEEIIESQRERLLAEGLSVSYRAPDTPLHVRIDRDALEQILLNLLDNAAKYASSGKRAEVVVEHDGPAWSLLVSDFGPGIPPAERKQVFAAFHRSDDRLTSERPGCGLGLSIAARLAAEMGGELTLEENQPSGCSFILKVKKA